MEFIVDADHFLFIQERLVRADTWLDRTNSTYQWVGVASGFLIHFDGHMGAVIPIGNGDSFGIEMNKGLWQKNSHEDRNARVLTIGNLLRTLPLDPKYT